jgi:hypothetical protein
MQIEIDSDVKPKRTYKQKRKHGEFFKSGLSTEPAKQRYVQPSPRGNNRHRSHLNETPNPMPMPLFDRTILRNGVKLMRRVKVKEAEA